MPKRFKDKEPNEPSKGVQKIVVGVKKTGKTGEQMKMTKCHIRIDKSGKSFKQIRGRLERAIFPKRNTPLAKSIFKTLSGNGIIIKGFIQECLADYFKEFMIQNGRNIGDYPFVKNYSEKPACIDITFNIVFAPSFEPLMELFVKAFIAVLMKKLAEKLISKDDSDKGNGTTIINNGILHVGDTTITNMEVKDKEEEKTTDNK